jgi:starch synthase
MQPIKVLYLASEADPLVKVGGLGDVAGSLPRALKQLSREKAGGTAIDIRLALPFHAAIRNKVSDPELLFEFEVASLAGPIKTQVYQTETNAVPTYLIAGEPIGEDALVYDPDPAVDGQKYIFFSMAALEMLKVLNWKPDILHANDWHTALSVYALETKRPTDQHFKDIRSVLTIHNLPFMGAGTAAAFDYFRLTPSRHPLMPWWATKFPLPLGLQAADRIVAVSPTYAREILTPEYGCSLEKFLQSRQRSISGIVNGIDQENWDPEKDVNIPVNFGAATLEMRVHNKIALTKEFSLDADPKIPLLIMISRMDQQKGVDLVVGGLNQAIHERWQAILLGTGDPKLEEACRKLEKNHPERVGAAIRFDVKLSRRMYAGADILLMPSRYEPCGLAQMMAMRYGCVPLARATGGLQDTIVDVASSGEKGTGFLFQPATATAFAETLHQALEIFPDQERWSAIQRRGMGQDFSWENSAIQYVKLYRELLQDQP